MTITSDVPDLLEVDCLDVHLGTGRAHVLHAVSLAIPEGTTLGLVGESGSGKSTLAKALVGINRVTDGTIRFRGADVTVMRGRERGALRRRIQLVPQDPYSSLNPRRTIGAALAEAISPRRVRVRAHTDRIVDLLRLVGLDEGAMTRLPREFSGGQRQRIAIARALAVEPDLLIADEITSALDLSTQASILELLVDLQRKLGLTMLFISHDLAVVEQVSDSVLVLLDGDVVECGPAQKVFSAPKDGYTKSLIDSIPGGPGFTLD